MRDGALGEELALNRRKLRQSPRGGGLSTSISLRKAKQAALGIAFRHEVSLCFFPEGKARTLRLHHKGWSLRLRSVSARRVAQARCLRYLWARSELEAFGVKMETFMRMQSAYDLAQTRKREKEIGVHSVCAQPGNLTKQ